MNNTLKLNKDFKRLYYRGKCIPCHNVVVYAQKNKLGKNRVGLTCGKSVGGAVLRNRAKRLMRESFRALSPRITGSFDIVIVARSRILSAEYDKVCADFMSAAEELNLIAENYEKDTY